VFKELLKKHGLIGFFHGHYRPHKTTERKIMKFMKILLSSVCAIAAMGMIAQAAESNVVSIPNGHGQSIILHRSDETSIAFYAAGSGAGTKVAQCSSCCKTQLTSKPNGHGQTIQLERQCSN
jgi:hypothetical protein